jgi:hypothetical protein
MVKMQKKNCTSSTITIGHVSCTLHGIRLDQLPHLGQKGLISLGTPELLSVLTPM